MAYFGLLFGLAFGLISGAVFHTVILNTGTTAFGFLSFLLPIIQPVTNFLAAFSGWLATGGLALAWLVINLLIFLLLTWVAQASLTFPTPKGKVDTTGRQLFFRGFGAGVSASINFVFYFLFTHWIFTILAFTMLIPILMPIGAVRHSRFYQGLIGWIGWIMPYCLLLNIPGLLVFLYYWATNSNGHRFDPTSGCIETLITLGPTASYSGFDIGIFTFVDDDSIGFLDPGTPAHEVGHGLTGPGLSSFWALATVFYEALTGNLTSGEVLNQLAAESRAPRPNRYYTDLWSS